MKGDLAAKDFWFFLGMMATHQHALSRAAQELAYDNSYWEGEENWPGDVAVNM